MTIEEAIELAARKHAGARDKAGLPYIWHPLRVALRLDCECAQIAAVLHDVLEDTQTSSKELREMGVPPLALRAIERLTKHRDEKGDANYVKFIRRVKGDPIARLVKEADLRDNLDPTRMRRLPPAERRRLRAKYRNVLAELRKR